MTSCFLLELSSSGERRKAEELHVERRRGRAEVWGKWTVHYGNRDPCVRTHTRSMPKNRHSPFYKVHYRHARTPLLISNTDICRVLMHANTHANTQSEIFKSLLLEEICLGCFFFCRWRSLSMGRFAQLPKCKPRCTRLHFVCLIQRKQNRTVF